MNRKSYILLLLILLCGWMSRAQNIEFVENKGQWEDGIRYRGLVSNGAFLIHKNGFTVVQYDAKQWEKLHEATHNRSFDPKGEGLTVRTHVYRVSFEGANLKTTRILPDKPLPTYSNYFLGNDRSKWASHCQNFQGITVKDIYPNIDLRYYSSNGTLKYDIIVHPGGKVSDIALRYEGQDALRIKNKELVIGTSVGELRELSPYTYQVSDAGKTEVGAKYVLDGSVVRFDVKAFDPKSTLVIDPTLVFCSFSGSTADNWGFSATYGPDGSMFGAGIVFGQGFPTSPGAYQVTFGGGNNSNSFNAGFDIGLIKLSPDGSTRMYATYLGGSGNEFPQSLIVDPAGQLIVFGRTESPRAPLTGSFPVGSAASQIGGGGGFDITVTKFNAAGTGLIGSMRIGGGRDDGANIRAYNGNGPSSLARNYGDDSRGEVNLDAAGNIYIASCTQSNGTSNTSLFPTTPGAFQTTFGGAQQDGVVLKFDPNLSTLLFSSLLGGGGDDAAYVLSLAGNGQIYVAGGTASGTGGNAPLPGASAGTIGATNQGVIDGFVSIIANNGSAILRTTYIGTGGIDQIYGIQFDRNGFPYVMGQTTGSWPIINAPWSQPNGKQFIAKLRPDLSAYVYSTAFGKGESSPDISPVAFLVDRCENVYISGWGGRVSNGLTFPTAGVQGLPVTADAIKSAPDINPQTGLGEDFYFFVLKKDAASQLYGSYFGQNSSVTGDHVDGGTSRFDENGVIYQAICASCGNTGPFPTTPGAWATTKPASANCNLAMVKIAFNLAGVSAGPVSTINGQVRDTAGCVPLTVTFSDTSLTAVRYEWNFGDGPGTTFTTQPTATHTYTAVGTYQVRLIAIDSTTCNVRDTAYLTILVGDEQANLDFVPVKLAPCDSFRYRFDNTSTAPPTRPFGPQTFTWDFGDGSPRVTTGPGPVFHNYASAGTYNVRLILRDSSYCNSPDTLVRQLRVASLVRAGFTTPPTGCAPYTAVFNNTSQAGAQFLWDFGGLGTSTAVNPTFTFPTPGTYVVTLIANDPNTCNLTDTTRFTITVYGKPTADFSAAPQPPVTNTPISFTNLSSPDAVRFKWLFGDGDSLVTTSRNVVRHEYNASQTYNACLIAQNVAGCPDTVCRSVRMLVEPAVDVPSAFTPTQPGANSVVFVRGFGIAKMKFTIYARWGEKVFESGNKNFGWDGRFNGKMLPMDVYAYTLDVEFSDGTKTRKTGDITLIR